MARTRLALAVATALAVGVAPAVLGGGTAVAAPVQAAGAAAETATVVQDGGPLVVPSGEEGAVTPRVTVTLPAGHTGRVKARLLLPTPTWEPTDQPAYALVSPSCAVNGGAFSPCPWVSWDNKPQLPDVEAEAATTITYDIRIDAESRAARMGNLTATLEVSDWDETVLARGPVAFQFVKGTLEAQYRTTVLARDKAGVFWQYESSGRADKPLKARERIGGGWNAYTSITSLTRRTAAGWGDLVARDRDGVLWYYGGSGNPDAPFKPRVRVGGGWNQYTALTGYNGGLTARDKDGKLWIYKRTSDPSRPFSTRAFVGGGWNVYNLIAGRGGGFGAVARDASGVLWSYGARHAGGWDEVYGPRQRVGGGWNVYDSVVATQDIDLDVAHRDDFLARDKDGHLWFYGGRGSLDVSDFDIPGSTRKQIGYGWGIYNAIL